MQTEQVLNYIQRGVDILIAKGRFANGDIFRLTQREALEAYRDFLARKDLPDEEKLKGFFEIPTGIGKTAIFAGLINEIYRVAHDDHEHPKILVVVPTIKLLDQTKRAFTKYAPDVKRHIGLYGDKHKDRDHDITIMTYDAWVTLSEEKQIGADSVDILISDEAHRGTSQHRVENIFPVFNGAAQVAFTATASFDTTKSVEQTHKNRVYHKKIADAVRGGELAHYVHTQFHVIRVQPPKNPKEFEDAAKGNGRYRSQIRQQAFNKRAVAIFRDGMDHLSGDPLSDNQAAFFTSDTTQADNLAALLNADLTLKHKAAALGMKGVAVSIHSKLSRAEQNRRFKDYEVGLYMAVVGDDMFKEGFDHPPMKTIIDCPHGSLVDKVQIIGRGTREWYNKLRQRYEGLAFIDTIVYIGSNDPAEDKYLRECALAEAVKASDVLGETYVLGPSAKLKLSSSQPKTKPQSVIISGQDVESYSELEDVANFISEVEKIKLLKNTNNLIPIPEEIFREKSRTRMSGWALLKGATDIPEGLDAQKINNWLSYANRIHYAREDHIEYVLSRYRKFPDEFGWGFEQDVVIFITGEMRQEMQDFRQRTGIEPAELMGHMEIVPMSLTAKKIEKILSTLRSCKKSHYDSIISAYKSVLVKEIKNDPLNRAEL